jgi:F420H(2)-dependent quinone reductase
VPALAGRHNGRSAESMERECMLYGQEHVDRYVETDGDEGHEWQGTTALILTTTGRRSGEPRRTPLIYQRFGDDYLSSPRRAGPTSRPRGT